MGFFDNKEERLKVIVSKFPPAFKQAQEDWAKFKLGVEQGLFSSDEKEQIVGWFDDFLSIWESIRPNWEFTVDGLISSRKAKFGQQVDEWINKLKGERQSNKALGLAPILIGVIWVVVATGVLGGVWAVIRNADANYLKQENISKLIELRLLGKISDSTLKVAIDKEKSPGIFGGIGDTISGAAKLGVLGAVVVLFGPEIKTFVTKAIR